MTTTTASGAIGARRASLVGAGAALALLGGLMSAPPAVAGNAPPVTGAAFTTTNTGVDGAGHCKNGNEDVNCNIYDGKDYVWLNGGPSTAYVGDGNYFFAVLVPGGQPDPNDTGAKNLSDDHDSYENRTFSVTGGVVSYTGNATGGETRHDFDSNKIRLMPYADTSNAGDVYILAICSLDAGYPIKPSRCKYDAFKVREATTEEPPEDLPLDPPTVSKDAEGAYDTTWTWGIKKDADRTLIQQVSGTATVNYTVEVSHDAGTNSGFAVTGTITVVNPNVDAAGDTMVLSGVTVTDELSDGTECSVTGGEYVTLAEFETEFAYSCTLTGLPQAQLDNVATVAWDRNTAPGRSTLEAGSDDFTFEEIAFAQNKIDECVEVTDVFNGAPAQSMGRVCVGDEDLSIEYPRNVDVPANDCVDIDNTATFTTEDTDTTGSDGHTVRVCTTAKGGLTMGFWQNKNGQALITGEAKTGVCPSATWLRQFAPFQDLSATATCAATGTYVLNTIKAANASGATMNAMLKAQMLATALNVYFSGPKLAPFNGGISRPLGDVKIDLTKICKMGTTGCTGTWRSASAAFGGASSMTVSQMLTYAASQSNLGGKTWYGNNKATQELAKDAFDCINNQFAWAV